MSSKRRWFALGALALSLALAVVVASRLRADTRGTDKKRGDEPRPVSIATAPVEVRDVPIILEALGNATALQMATIRSQVEGRLERVLFEEGKDVKKGDVLAEVDARPYLAQLNQLESQAARDRAQLENSKLALDRTKNLAKEELVTQQQLEDQRALVKQYQAGVGASVAQAAGARLQVDYARIRAPFDGVTGVRQVDPGNLVRPTDANGIVVLAQIDPIAVIFTLPQDDLPRVAREMATRSLTIDAFSRDGTTKLGSGEVTVIDNQVNAQTATIRIKAVVPNPDRVLWPNLFVKARLLLTTRKDVTVIPAVAVQRGPQGTFVYVVTPDQKAAPKNVEVDAIEGEICILRSGLTVKDVVVTEGQSQLRPGSSVVTKPVAKPRPAPSGKTREAGAP
jgi:membrane fusion protein, multidrug efflux system